MTIPQRRVLRISPQDIDEARKRLKGLVVRTPLVPLNLEDSPAEIYLKLENLQPTGSFKVRGAGNAIEHLSPEQLAKGVYTCSGGNMAQALAWHAHRHRIPCTAIVPDTAAETKLAGIRRCGADIIQVPFEEVWKVATDHVYPPLKDRIFVHPFSNAQMIAGNGTIGLEILEDLSDVDSVIVPFGGGGLFAGIAIAMKSRKPQVNMYGCEPDTACAFAASLAAGSPKTCDANPELPRGNGRERCAPRDMGPRQAARSRLARRELEARSPRRCESCSSGTEWSLKGQAQVLWPRLSRARQGKVQLFA